MATAAVKTLEDLEALPVEILTAEEVAPLCRRVTGDAARKTGIQGHHGIPQ